MTTVLVEQPLAGCQAMLASCAVQYSAVYYRVLWEGAPTIPVHSYPRVMQQDSALLDWLTDLTRFTLNTQHSTIYTQHSILNTK